MAIATSTDSHVELLTAAAPSGKAIMCEKPISLDLAATDDALAAVDRAGARLHIGFNRRFDPAHRFVRDAAADGSLGPLHLVRISSRDPVPPPLDYILVSGGIFLDMTCHDIDMARFVTGSEVVEVHAQGAVRVDPAIGEAGDLDTVVLTLRHADGCLTVIDNSRRAVYGYDQRVEAFGAAGMATSQNPPAHSGVVIDADGTRGPALGYFFLERYLPSYIAQWQAFAAFTLDGGEAPVSGADGRATLAVGLAAWQSVREGRRRRRVTTGQASTDTGAPRWATSRPPTSSTPVRARAGHAPAGARGSPVTTSKRPLCLGHSMQPSMSSAVGEVGQAVGADAVEQDVGVGGRSAQHERGACGVDALEPADGQAVDRSEVDGAVGDRRLLDHRRRGGVAGTSPAP